MTSQLTADEHQSIADLVAQRRPGYSLPGEFYSNDAVYRAEIERIWRRGWLFVGHSCEIPHPGDYLTFTVENESLIIVRDHDGRANALWNVCRHRGTQICGEERGCAMRLVCPYHQWAFDLDGALISCRGGRTTSTKSN